MDDEIGESMEPMEEVALIGSLVLSEFDASIAWPERDPLCSGFTLPRAISQITAW